MTTEKMPDRAFLTLLALLGSFDRDMLRSLTTLGDTDLGDLFTNDAVITFGDQSGFCTLVPEAAAAALASLDGEGVVLEIDLRTRAFEYFVERRQRNSSDAGSDDVEKRCFDQLDRLFYLLLPRLEWSAIERLITLARAIEPTQHRHHQRLQLYEGYVAVRTQQYDRGVPLLYALIDQLHLEDTIRVNALTALANAFQMQARYDLALSIYEQLHAVARETHNPAFEGVALVNMSMIYNEIEAFDRALDLALQSVEIFQSQGQAVREGYALYSAGLNALYLGRWQSSRDYLDRAIAIFDAHKMQSGLAMLYWSQGFSSYLLGDERHAEEAYVRAINLASSNEHGDPSVEMDGWLYLGVLQSNQDRGVEALSSFARALDLAQQLRREHRIGAIFYQRGNVLLKLGRVDETFAAYEQAIERIEALRGATESEEIKIGLLGTTQQVYEAMVRLCLLHGREHEAFGYAERARSRAFLDTLVAKAPELAPSVEQPVATLDEVQRTLPEGALLLEYFTAGVLPRGEHLINRLPPENRRLREHLVQPPEVWVFAVARDAFEVHHVELDPNTLRPLSNDPGPGRRLLLNERLMATLRQRLLGPVKHLLPGRDTLFLIPHGPLHYVPWPALPDSDGRFLVEPGAPALAMAPSATVLLRACLRPRRTAGGGSLALGYNDRGERELVAAEAEARAVARQLGGEVWWGPEPKGARLLAFDRELRRLHFAGHAVYRPDDPLGSELRLGADDALTARQIIAGLELDADLVTLSACTSGLSHVVSGDELLGLQRAFLYAGARAVLCTLWEATDIAAMLVMERFYGALNRGVPAAAALRDAQVAVRELRGHELAQTLERWREDEPEQAALFADLLPGALAEPEARPMADPFYWAPFMLIGKPG